MLEKNGCDNNASIVGNPPLHASDDNIETSTDSVKNEFVSVGLTV